MNTERELTEDELNAVTGGLMYVGQCSPCHAEYFPGRPPPANAAAMAAWNNLLTQYGF
jgi:bacteriocin-like protein